MNNSDKTSQQTGAQDGMALVLVLSFLVLITALILAFYSSVTTELQGATSYSSGVRSKNLTDTAVQTVMGTIRTATSRGTGVAWASQPGMIRTYGTSSGAASAAPLSYYKLYSSQNMEVTASQTGSFDPGADVDGQWDLKPALFTDLNSPVIDPAGKPRFPIIDPRIQTSEGSAMVDGFSYSSVVNKTVTSGGDSQRLPMPVRWIYQLKDGTLTAPTGVDPANSAVATWTGAPAYKTPSVSNPIVGRIAFWTDDESCKVNINTASEGVYWDVPRLMSLEDYGIFQKGPYSPGMSYSQPAQHEFNRYPGHPACTSLSAIFGSSNWSPPLLPVPAPYPANPTLTDAQMLDPYFNLVPRVGLPAGGGSGGSKGGYKKVDLNSAVMVTDSDRLYASVDELMFTPNLSGAARVPNTSTTTAPKTITKDVLEKTRFFLTASSSAPETTVFNTPRVAVWPVWSPSALAAGKTNTAYDKLLMFCSTIGGKVYGFSRSNARSCTDDYNNIPRNQELYAYLQKLTGNNIPGFGGKFLSKYPAGPGGVKERDQILTYIYDYIRCTNLQDRSAGASSFTPLFTNNTQKVRGPGEVLPIKIPVNGGTTQGFGRFLSVTTANLVFYCTNRSGGRTQAMRAAFVLNPASPAQGVACTRSYLKYKVTGLESLRANDVSLNFKTDVNEGNGTSYIDVSGLNQSAGGLGGAESQALHSCYTDMSTGAMTPKTASDSDAGANSPDKYPFFSYADVPVTYDTAKPANSQSFSFKALSDIVVEVRAADTDELVQKLRFKFPDGQFKVPGSPNNSGPFTVNPISKLTSIYGFDVIVGLVVGGADTNANLNSPARTVDNTAGDIRLVAGLADVPANRYRAHFNYKDPVPTANGFFAFHMLGGNGSPISRATYGKLANVTSYTPTGGGYTHQPDVPACVTTGASRSVAANSPPGDWDTGWGDKSDGAYINKPDEANIQPGGDIAYRGGYNRGVESAVNVYFSPNRMIASPMMFGSLPTGVQRNLPWQTLLFHPRPEDLSHPGNGSPANPALGTSYTTPPDHLLADLFWMPVVEPYAISQPFATSGKINLNYQIAPFTYIKRATGIHAVMKSTKFAAVPLGDASDNKGYKAANQYDNGSNTIPTFIPNRRRNIDMDKTLVAFDEKFKNNDLFRSASQICEIDLVPGPDPNTTTPINVTPSAPTVAATKTAMAAFWNSHQLTGDNLREKPYVDLYSRLTTKSNAYTVHYRVQVLKKSRSSAANVWDESKDTVTSEERGSSLIERYVDVSNNTLPDFAAPGAPDLDTYYKFRILATKRF